MTIRVKSIEDLWSKIEVIEDISNLSNRRFMVIEVIEDISNLFNRSFNGNRTNRINSELS